MAKQSRISNPQRRMAASILGCGMHRVWIDPGKAEAVSQAITRGDIRRLVSDGTIRKLPAKKWMTGKEKGKQRTGSRKGSRGARQRKKEIWLKMVRPQRKLLREIKPKLSPMSYRKLYRMIKGGSFRSKAHMQLYLKEKKLLSEK